MRRVRVEHVLVFALAMTSGADASWSDHGTTIAIVDTGIDPFHPEFAPNRLVGWIDLVNGGTGPYDDHGHGTAVSSRAAGATLGSAPQSRILVVKALDARGVATVERIVSGIEWAARAGADIIVVTTGYDVPQPPAALAWSRAVEEAERHGALVVWSAGNGGTVEWIRATGEETRVPSPVPAWTLPGASASVSISVGSLDAAGRPSEFSQPWPDLLARGEGVRVAWPGGGYRDDLAGTSLSAPWVAGLVARLDEALDHPPVAELRRAALRAAFDTPASCEEEGYGHLDALPQLLPAEGMDERDACMLAPEAVRAASRALP